MKEVPGDVPRASVIVNGLDRNVAYEVIITSYSSDGSGTPGRPMILERKSINWLRCDQ